MDDNEDQTEEESVVIERPTLLTHDGKLFNNKTSAYMRDMLTPEE
jgi:hypothetical protein